MKAVGRHFDYLRLRDDGELEIEADDGRRLAGDDVTRVTPPHFRSSAKRITDSSLSIKRTANMTSFMKLPYAL